MFPDSEFALGASQRIAHLGSLDMLLSPQERKQATVLYRALMRVQTLADQGESDSASLLAAGKQVIAEAPAVKLDYFEIVNSDTLEPVSNISRGALVAVAAYVGNTRLIDNVVLMGVGQVERITEASAETQ